MRVQKFKRGQIWWYEYNGTQYDGSVMGKTRPVIIVSNDAANAFSNCLIGIPCTTQEKKDMPTHLTTSIHGTHSTILAENIISINISRLTDYIGMVDEELMHEIDNILAIAVGLKEVEKQSYSETIETEVNNTVSISNPTNEVKSNEIQSDSLSDNSNAISDEHIGRRGKKPTFTNTQLLAILDDYEVNGADFCIAKYGIKDRKSLSNYLYKCRKLERR